MGQKKDKNGTWYCYGSYVYNGERKQFKKRGFATKKQAKEYEEEFLSNKNYIPRLKFSDLVSDYFRYAENHLKESTYRTNLSMCRPYEKAFNSRYIDDITRHDLQDFMDSYEKDHEKGYMLQLRAFGNKLFNYAVKREMIEKNPMAFVEVERRPNEHKERLFWEQDEFEQFISVVDDIMYKTLYMTLYYMGVRIGECLALQWKDIDMIHKQMNINKTTNDSLRTRKVKYSTPKTKNSYRIISIPNILLNQLKEWYDVQSNFYVFNGEESFVFGNTETLVFTTVRENLYRYIKKAGVKKIRIHDFRHSHASYLINNMSKGFTDFDIARRLGDTVNTLHNTYAHWFKRKDEDIIDFMNNDIKSVEYVIRKRDEELRQNISIN